MNTVTPPPPLPAPFVALVPVPDSDPTPTKRADLPTIWEGYHKQALALLPTAEGLTVTDESDSANMRLARQTRLALREIRLAVEKKRKELTDEHLRTKQRIDKDAKALKDFIEPLEERLLYQEQFAERQEEARRLHLTHEREAALSPYEVDLSALAPLGTMT